MNIPPTGLDVKGVHVWRGDRHVLRGVGLQAFPGEALHIRGANGSGKTTLLRVACGLLRPEQGSVSWQGQSIYDDPGTYQAAMTYASHEPALKGDLTALENLRFMVALKRRCSDVELGAHLARVGVDNCANLPARVLSAGQRRRVSMARVLATGAALWLLDEPFTNLDVRGSDLMRELLDQHVAAGGLALIVAHHELGLARISRQLELGA